MLQHERIDTSEESDLDKLTNQKKVKSVVTTISTMVLNLIRNFVMLVIVE